MEANNEENEEKNEKSEEKNEEKTSELADENEAECSDEPAVAKLEQNEARTSENVDENAAENGDEAIVVDGDENAAEKAAENGDEAIVVDGETCFIPMNIDSAKTPISLLKEITSKRGLTPLYDLIATEGPIHEPIFVFRVTIGDLHSLGKGTSKKRAKHASAQAILEKIRREKYLEMDSFFSLCKLDTSVMSPHDDGIDGNPVGELQEFAQRQFVSPPFYEFIEQICPDGRDFFCYVRFGEHQEQGVGKSKKLAKRQSAFMMLQKLSELNILPAKAKERRPDANEYDATDDADCLYPLAASSSAAPNGKTRTISAPSLAQMKQIVSETIETIRHFHPPPPPQPLASTATAADHAAADDDDDDEVEEEAEDGHDNGAHSTEAFEILKKLSMEQKFRIEYVDLPEIGHHGLYQCLVQLHINPVSVLNGEGQSIEKAQQDAATTAIHYLKEMLSDE